MIATRTRPGWARSLVRAVIVCTTLSGLLFAYARLGRGYEFAGTPMTPEPAPGLDLTNDRGDAFDLGSLRGKAVLVYFGYTHCPDVCPTTLAQFAPIFADLGADQRRTAIVFVTLDPARDDPKTLHAYLASFEPVPIGLTGSPPLVADAARRWSIAWRPSAGGAFLDHASVVTLVGPEGHLRAHYGLSQIAKPHAVARDIRHVLAN